MRGLRTSTTQRSRKMSNYFDAESGIEEDIENAWEKSGLEIDEAFDNIYSERLPGNAVGAAAPKRKMNGPIPDHSTDLIIDNQMFPYMSKEEREHVLIHEYVHALNNEGKLYNKLLEEGMSLEAAENLWNLANSGWEPAEEGATELIALYLDPDAEEVAGMAYPGETEQVYEILENSTDPDYMDTFDYLSGDNQGYI